MFDSYHFANGINFPACQCCGDYGFQAMRGMELVAGVHKEPSAVYRCARHVGRNPCAIDGCARTGSAGDAPPYRYGDGHVICGKHWRMAAPPRSRQRRAYHAYFRRAKKYGWSAELRGRFHRFWDTLIIRARASRGPPMDIDEINRMFGWDK